MAVLCSVVANCLWSERRELNPRPQAPQTCAIPLRYAPKFKHYQRYLDAAGGQLPLRYAPIVCGLRFEVSGDQRLTRYHYATPRLDNASS